MSYIEVKDVPTVLKNMNFHLNQVNADVSAEKKISSGTKAFVNTHYQGSNIGQSVSILAGLNIKAPQGAQILVFTGYSNNDLKGYQTQHSLIASPSGPQFGAKYVTKKGVEFSGAVRGVAGKPSVGIKLKVPLGGK
jgi:hypothetical protein